MKKRILISAFLSILFCLGSFSSAFAFVGSSQLLPAQQDTTSDEVSLYSGEATHSIPLEVPPGTNGLTPNLSLQYNSSTVESHSGAAFLSGNLFGAGWSIDFPYVYRDTNYTPDDTSDDKYRIDWQGVSYKLIDQGSGKFKTNIETFTNITHQTGSTNNASGDYWIVQTTDGTTYRFGYNASSEVACSNRSSMPLEWVIDTVTDTHSNNIYYNYSQNPNSNDIGTIYPTSIQYNSEKSRAVNFAFSSSDSPTMTEEYFEGCLVRYSRNLTSVTTTANGSPVKKYNLNYTNTITHNLLSSVTELGSDNTPKPANSFQYNPEAAGWASTFTRWGSLGLDFNSNSQNVRLADMNGDGLTDLVYVDSSGFHVYLNNGSGFNTTSQSWGNLGIDFNSNSKNVQLADMNGDGLTDLVYADSGGFHVYINNGSGFNTTSQSWGAAGYTFTWNSNNVQLADMNGDGLPDLVYADSSGFHVMMNTGSSFSSTSQAWGASTFSFTWNNSNVRLADMNGDGLTDMIFADSAGCYVYLNTGTGFTSNWQRWASGTNDFNWNNGNVRLADMNGDGLTDMVFADSNGYYVYFNTGNSFSMPFVRWSNNGDDFNWNNGNVRLADMNGDGLTDMIFADSNGFYIYPETVSSPYLLSNIHTETGATINYNYEESTGTSGTKLPFNEWLVSQMTVDNGMTNSEHTTDTTTYTYKNGAFNWPNREFRGFGEVDETDPNSAKKQTFFDQDDALKGTLYKQVVTDSSGNPYAETDDTWNSATSSGVFTNTLTSEKNYTYDGTSSNPKITETDYQYDQYGNVTKESDLGDTSVTGDERFTHNEYTYNTSSWIVNTLDHTYLNGSDDSTKINETWDYYDGNSGLTDSPTKGDLTKEVQWSNESGLSNPTTTYQYDSYGNKTQEISPNNNTTTYTYDSSTHTYAISTTNAKSQTTTITNDLGTGNLLSKTDPNGLTTSYTYDAFGRKTKEIDPYDSSSSPTKQYSYINDGVAPDGIIVSQRTSGSTSATLNTFTFFDGLGRKIQTRQDAKNPSQQIIADTFYDSTGKVKQQTVPYLASSSASANYSAPAASKFGDGSDGDLTISSNTTASPVDASVNATAGTDIATIGSGLNFVPDDIVLLYQTQGMNSGYWEYARIQSYVGSTLTFTGYLTNTYTTSGNNHAQIIVVPQYHNVTVNSGVTWSAKAWNGTTGGILVFLASGTVTVNGTITSLGEGFIGGAAGRIDLSTQPKYGENDAAPSGDGTGNPGVAVSNGGGAFQDSSALSSGGGGANATAGGNGFAANGATTTTGTADLTSMVFGGGGGGGSANLSSYANSAAGGNGGGSIFISASSVAVTGSINSNGSTGTSATDHNGGRGYAGGGGAGGDVLIRTQTATLGSSLITASGGAGGAGVGSAEIHPGGNGGNGRVRIEYETSMTGSTTPTASTAQVTTPLLPEGIIYVTGVYSTPDSTVKYTQYAYDPLGRETTETNPDTTFKTAAYDHWKETLIDENGHIKRQYRNAYGKINKVEEVNGSDTYTTTYEYDSNDLLTKVTDDKGNITTTTYDSLGNKISQTNPDSGTWQYAYDGNGNVTKVTDNRGIITTNTYDALDRVIKKDYPTDTDTTFAYDIGKIGTLSIATDSAGTVFYSYDNRLRKTQEQRSINGTTKTTQFSYDSADRMVTQTNPDGEVVTNAYNPQGNVNSVSGNSSIVSNIDYNAQGKITKKDFANGLSTNYTYDTNNFRLDRIQTGSVQDLNYAYDNVGNVKTTADNVASKTQTFGYDTLDRLTSASDSAGFNYNYQYNSIGNLTNATNNTTGNSTNYTYGQNAGPHALSIASSSAAQASSSATEILGTTWTLAGNNGSDEADKTISANSLSGITSVQVTFNLHGTSFGNGDDEASVVFVQNGDWRAANVIVNGGTNGMNGSQTVTIPVSSFHKVGDSSTVLDPNQTVTNLHTRFWNSGSFSVDITSVKLIGSSGGGSSTPTNLALGKSVTTSSVESSDPTLVGSNAVDGDSGTRWSSSFSDPQWIYVDLGAPTAINHVKLTWEAAYASGYQIQVSNDATNWTTIYTTTTGDGGVDDLTTLSGTGRYVRMYGTNRATIWGYSLYEFEVYGSSVTTSYQTVSMSNLTSGSDTDGNSTASTASVSPAANKLELLTISSKTNISTNPNQPTVSGNGLTWIPLKSTVYDTTSSSRRRVTLFRATGSSTSSGAASISFGGQNQTDVSWIFDQVTNVDTSGTITLDSYSSSNMSSNDAAQSTSNPGAGQIFTPSQNTVLDSAQFYLSKVGSPTGSGFAKIYAISGTHGTNAIPTGSALATSDAIDVSTLTGSNQMITLHFSGANRIALTSGTWYAISFEYTNGNTSNYVSIGADDTSPTHAGNEFYYSSGWVGDSTWDDIFSVSGTTAGIVQSVASNAQAATSLSVSLAAFANSSNATYGAFGNDDGNGGGANALTVGSGFTISAQTGTTGVRTGTEFNAGNATTVGVIQGTDDIGGIAIELQAGTTTTSSTPLANGPYTYDADGNMVSNGLNCYHYNDSNELDRVTNCNTQQTIAEYVYDYNGNRMVKRNFANGTQINAVISWSDSFETTTTPGGTQTGSTAYYFANDQLVAKKNSNGSMYYIQSDNLGSTSVVTDQSGAVVERTSYDPWGNIKAGGTQSKFLYTGQEMDSETGLDYYNARYYDPYIRRFTQPDSVIADVYNPQELNLYSYVNNNPLTYIDPTGRVVTCTSSGCYSSITILNPAPKQTAPKTTPISQYIPYYTAAVGTSSSSSRSSSGGGGGSGNSSSSGSSGDSSNIPHSTPSIESILGSVQLSNGSPSLQYSTINPFKLATTYVKDSSAFPDMEGWEWAGNGSKGSRRGNMINRKTEESVNRDVPHAKPGYPDDPKGDHINYRYPDGPPYNGQEIDINSDGLQINKQGDIIGYPVGWNSGKFLEEPIIIPE